MSRIPVVLVLVVVACATADLLRSFEKVDVNDHDVLTVADYTVRSYNIFKKFYYRLVKVVRAYKQIGTYNYQLEFIVGLTICKQQEVSYEDAKKCDIQDGEDAYEKCTVVALFNNRKGIFKGQAPECISISKKDI